MKQAIDLLKMRIEYKETQLKLLQGLRFYVDERATIEAYLKELRKAVDILEREEHQ